MKCFDGVLIGRSNQTVRTAELSSHFSHTLHTVWCWIGKWNGWKLFHDVIACDYCFFLNWPKWWTHLIQMPTAINICARLSSSSSFWMKRIFEAFSLIVLRPFLVGLYTNIKCTLCTLTHKCELRACFKQAIANCWHGTEEKQKLQAPGTYNDADVCVFG